MSESTLLMVRARRKCGDVVAKAGGDGEERRDMDGGQQTGSSRPQHFFSFEFITVNILPLYLTTSRFALSSGNQYTIPIHPRVRHGSTADEEKCSKGAVFRFSLDVHNAVQICFHQSFQKSKFLDCSSSSKQIRSGQRGV